MKPPIWIKVDIEATVQPCYYFLSFLIVLAAVFPPQCSMFSVTSFLQKKTDNRLNRGIHNASAPFVIRPRRAFFIQELSSFLYSNNLFKPYNRYTRFYDPPYAGYVACTICKISSILISPQPFFLTCE